MIWIASLIFALFFALFQDAGTKALEAGNYPAAIAAFGEAVQKDPQDLYSQFNLALAYSGAGQTEKAIEAYRRTLTLKPKLYEAELNLGIVLVQAGRGAEAIEVLEDSRTQKPGEFRPAFFLGEALFAAGQYGNAEAAYAAAVALKAQDAPAQYGLARAILKQGRLDDAAQHYRSAAAIDARYHAAMMELGTAYEQDQQIDKAMAIYRELPAAQSHLSTLLIQQNKAAEAVAALEDAAAKSPTAANQAALVTAYVRAKQPDKALPLVERLINANPKDTELILLRGRIYRDQRKFKEAANSFYAVTKLKPDSVEAWNEFSAMLISLENYPAALSALDRIRELNAERPPHLFFRAIILDKMKQLKPALEAYKRYLELSHDQNPDQEFQARQRVRIIEHELNNRRR